MNNSQGCKWTLKNKYWQHKLNLTLVFKHSNLIFQSLQQPHLNIFFAQLCIYDKKKHKLDFNNIQDVKLKNQITNRGKPTMMKKSPTFPPSKIKKIIQQNQQVGKLSNVVPFLMERSLQLFLTDVVEKVNQIVKANELVKASPCVLKKAIDELPKYQFMKFAVQDLEDFQCLKKKKSEVKTQKAQKKKNSKTQIDPPPPPPSQTTQPPSKRGRKKIVKQEKN